MKIALFDPYLDTVSGGEKYILTIASYLSQEHEVFVFWDPKKEEEIKKIAKNKLNIDLTKVQFISSIFDKKTLFLTRIVESRKYDYIFYLSDGSIPIVFPRKKLILHFQFPVEWVRPTIKTFIKKLFVSSIICNSLFTKEHIDKKFHVKSSVIYPPVVIPKLVNLEDKENIILTVGRLELLPDGSTFKKQELLINLFKKIDKKLIKNWKLYIITSSFGENTGYTTLEKEIDGFPIKILKNISLSEIQALYRKSTIYWHAAGYNEDIHTHPERAEHFGISTVEAMSYGSIPIVYDAGGQKEIVENNLYGFLWQTPEELIEKTELLIKDSNLRGEFVTKCRGRSQKYSIENFKNAIGTIL